MVSLVSKYEGMYRICLPGTFNMYGVLLPMDITTFPNIFGYSKIIFLNSAKLNSSSYTDFNFEYYDNLKL